MMEKEFSVLHVLRGAEDLPALDFLASLLGGPTVKVRLMCVAEEPPMIEDESRREFSIEHRKEIGGPDPEELITGAKAKLEEVAPHLSVSSLAATGDPVEEVLSQLDREDYDLLSLEAYGRGGFRRNILGAHVNELVQESTKPTLVHKGQLRTCERVLIHVPNNRERCTGLVTYFADLFEGTGMKITFLTILSDEDEKFEGYISGEEDYMEESIENYDREELGYLEIAREILGNRDMEAEVRYRIGDTQEEILTEAQEGRYDLMAFFPEKKNVLASLWSGDKSLKLMQRIDISLLKFTGPGAEKG